MPPNASANGPTNGMVPPTPMYTGSTPKPGAQGALGGVERPAGRVAVPRGHLVERRDGELEPERHASLEVRRAARR